MKINILLNNNFFKDHCTYCFIYPIIKSFNLIKESNVSINLVYSLTKESFDCDTLIIDSRFDGIKENKKFFLKVLNKNLIFLFNFHFLIFNELILFFLF